MENCKPLSTPLKLKINTDELTKSKKNKTDSMKYPCRIAIGSLVYVMPCTRPDLS